MTQLEAAKAHYELAVKEIERLRANIREAVNALNHDYPKVAIALNALRRALTEQI